MSFNIDSGAVKILRRDVIEDARKEAEAILKDGNVSVGDIEAEAEETRDYLENIQIKRKINLLDDEFKDNAGSLERYRARRLLQFKQDSLQGVIDEAINRFKSRLTANPEYYYDTYLKALIQAALDSTAFKEYQLIVNPQDKNYIQENPEYLALFTKKITLKDETLSEDDVGCVLQDKESSIQFDNRLSKKIETRLSFLKIKISPVLFKQA